MSQASFTSLGIANLVVNEIGDCVFTAGSISAYGRLSAVRVA
jgi:hypothetical protein